MGLELMKRDQISSFPSSNEGKGLKKRNRKVKFRRVLLIHIAGGKEKLGDHARSSGERNDPRSMSFGYRLVRIPFLFLLFSLSLVLF